MRIGKSHRRRRRVLVVMTGVRSGVRKRRGEVKKKTQVDFIILFLLLMDRQRREER